MKIIILVLFSICLIVGCGIKSPKPSEADKDDVEITLDKSIEVDTTQAEVVNNISDNTESNVEIISEPQEYIFDIFTVFELSKEDIIEKMGSEYQIIPAGAEGSYEGYLYNELSVSFVFDPYNYVEFIECGDGFNINGAKAGMKFSEIQEILGSKEIEDSWYESQDNKAYKLKYTIDGLVFDFIAFESDSNETYLTVYKERESQ